MGAVPPHRLFASSLYQNEVMGLQVANRMALQAKLLRGFGDPIRLAILNALRDSPRTVTELVQLLGTSQSNTSNHLACLRDCGLVHDARNGRHVQYRLSSEPVSELLQASETLLDTVLAGILECARYAGAADE